MIQVDTFWLHTEQQQKCPQLQKRWERERENYQRMTRRNRQRDKEREWFVYGTKTISILRSLQTLHSICRSCSCFCSCISRPFWSWWTRINTRTINENLTKKEKSKKLSDRPESNQGPIDFCTTTVYRSTNWATVGYRNSKDKENLNCSLSAPSLCARLPTAKFQFVRERAHPILPTSRQVVVHI